MNKREIKRKLLVHIAEMLQYDVDEWAAAVIDQPSDDQVDQVETVINNLRDEFYRRGGINF